MKRITDSLSQDSKINVAAIYHNPILHRATLDGAVEALATATSEMKSLAYELAGDLAPARIFHQDRCLVPSVIGSYRATIGRQDGLRHDRSRRSGFRQVPLAFMGAG